MGLKNPFHQGHVAVGISRPPEKPLALDATVAQDFASIPQVSCVLTQQRDGTLKVWIGLEDASNEVRDLVFDKELAAIDAFPSIDFDFSLVTLLGRRYEDVISDPVTVAYRRN